jgi:MFS-type transporter involved in bile tolerance (Atg22 family)
VAGTVGRVQDFIVEDREVERKTKADRVSGGQLGLGDIGGALEVGTVMLAFYHSRLQRQDKVCGGSYLVGLVGSGGSNLALLAGSELGEVTVVVTLPMMCALR